MRKGQVDIFLDSGAYTAHTKGITIDIQKYIAFIKKHKDYITVYANLDVIGDAAATWRNQRIMEDAGLSPLPCFHRGEPFRYLKHYATHYDYICLGGMVGKKTPIPWLDECFEIIKAISNEKGKAVKVHGFAVWRVDLLIRYPWYSVDSATWVMLRNNGSVYVPRSKNGKYDYRENPFQIKVSSTQSHKGGKGQYIWSTMDQKLKDYCKKYFEEKGFKIGEYDLKFVDPNYKLATRERWNPHADRDGKKAVEITIESGLWDDVCLADELNAIYFIDLERELSRRSRSACCNGAVIGL